MDYTNFDKKNINNTRNKKKNRNLFVSSLLLILAFLLFVYSTVSIYMFYLEFKGDESKDITEEETINSEIYEQYGEVDGRTIGNLTLSVDEIFGIHNLRESTLGMFVFGGLCVMFVASLILLIVSYKRIAKARCQKSLKAAIILLLTLAGLIIGIFLTYEIYGLQLTLFKSDKDLEQGEINAVCMDTGNKFYMLDGNGVPYLALELNQEISNDEYLAVSKELGLSDIDLLYVTCKFTSPDTTATEGLTKETKIAISDFFIEDSDGNNEKIDLTCKNTQKVLPILYTLNVGTHHVEYKLATTDTGERSDPDSKTTFLIVGKDRVALNTDVMILMSLDDDNGKYSAQILQIPRDTYCRDNTPNNKINSCYSEYYDACASNSVTEKITAGMEGLTGMLERNLLIKIDYWAIMDLDGFSSIVNAIDGVDMYVPFDMHYEDYSATPPLVIDLKEGQQTLYGNAAEQFIRYRKGYVTGDLGRVDATKLFLTSFFCKLRSELSITNPVALSQTVSTLLNYVTTDMDSGNAVYYLKKVLKLSLEDIKFLSVPGDDSATDESNASFYTSNLKGLYYVINTYFNVYDTDINFAEFDASRMFTTARKYTDIDYSHNTSFNEEQYEENVSYAEEIKEDNDKGENNLPTKKGL